MWVWDSTTFFGTRSDERDGVWTSRWESEPEQLYEPLPKDASVETLIGRILATIILIGVVAYMWSALGI